MRSIPSQSFHLQIVAMAKMRPCVVCGKAVSTSARTCPHCGHFEAFGITAGARWTKALVAGFVLTPVIAILATILSANESDADRRAFEEKSLAAASVLATPPRSPMSWELLNHDQPLRLQSYGSVCKTIQLAETVGDIENARGCMGPGRNQVVWVTWLGNGEGEYVRYQHVRAKFGSRDFDGWALAVDLANE